MNDLDERMKADLRLRNLRPSTQAPYLRCVERLGEYHRKSPEQLDAEAVREYLYDLQGRCMLKPSSVRVHVAAIRFLYVVTLGRPEVVDQLRGPKIPRRLPEVLSGTEVAMLLDSVRSVRYRALFMTVYGAGLRISEACTLHIRDIDSKRMVLRIRESKGGGNRLALLSERLLVVLRTYYVQHGETFRAGRALPPEQRKAMWSIEACRSAVLGGHMDVWARCDYSKPSYNSCRNRSCPKCQALTQARWLARRRERILQHVLPTGFTKIRHFGLKAPANVNTRLVAARKALSPASPPHQDTPASDVATLTWGDLLAKLTGIDLTACPACGEHAIQRIPIGPGPPLRGPP